MLTSMPARRNRPLAIVTRISLAIVAFLFLLWSFASPFIIPSTETKILPAPQYTQALVPLEAHIMSKCPDARVGYQSYES